LIGVCAKCAAGDFRFDHVATADDRLRRGEGDIEKVAPLPISAEDWPTYRGNIHRTAGTTARVARQVTHRWRHVPQRPYVPTVPTSVGGLVFLGGSDGVVRALDAATGALRWEFATPGEIKMPPAIAHDRAYVGCADGYVYALEAATGRLLWQFRAAPVERHIMVYGTLSSTWPVGSGVLVHEGVAYFAAGIIDYDGTYVYALDAETGKIKWQNNSCGHLSKELRKGISVQGNLTIRGDRLLLAGGNQVSPAAFDLNSGKCLAGTFPQGQPKANNGKFVGVFREQQTIYGGRILYSAPENVATKSSFVAITPGKAFTLSFGGVPPAWDDDTLALVNFRRGKLTCCETDKVAARIDKGFPQPPRIRHWQANLAETLRADGAIRWQSDLGQPNKFEALSTAVCPKTVVAVVQYQPMSRAHPEWSVVAFDKNNGAVVWRQGIPAQPLPGGLLIDRQGQVVVTMLDGTVLCLGPPD
jgi:outer membrane protein assembly factor BamB